MFNESSIIICFTAKMWQSGYLGKSQMPYGISGLWYVALLSPVPGLVGLRWPDLFLLT